MVGFGNLIQKAKRDEWEAAYIDYDRLKYIVQDVERFLRMDRDELVSEEATALTSIPGTSENLSRSENLDALKALFLRELTLEVEKISLFTLQQQGKLADAIGSIRFESTHIFQQFNSSLLGTAAIYNNRMYQHVAIGTEFLHLLRFICLNSIGVRKILKKFNKLFEHKDEEEQWYTVEGNHLQQLSLSRSVRAIQTSLEHEFHRLYFDLYQSPVSDHHVIQVIRFRSIMDCAQSIQRYTEILQQSFWNFLSSSSMIGTTVNFGGMDRASNDAMKWLMRLDPESIMSMDEEELKSLGYIWPVIPSGEPSVRPLPDLRRQPLSTIREETSGSILSLDEAHTFTDDEFEKRLFWGGVDRKTMVLNLVSKLLYTVNYYIVAPTANHYATNLGLPGAFGATLIGASSTSAFLAAFIFSYWSTRSSFKSALVFSAMCPVLGNLLYAIAISCHSMKMAMIGRILVGFGSAEVVNRQLISACVSFDNMTRASVLFVISDAAGMSIGPMMAAILDTVSGRDNNVDIAIPFLPAGGIIYNHITSPGYVMSAIWFLEFLALVIFFREPARLNEEDDGGLSGTHSAQNESSKSTGDEVNGNVLSKQEGYGSIASQDSSLVKSKRHDSTFQLVFKNPGLPLTVVLFGYVEMTCEVLISSCSMVVRRYFGWHANKAGLLLACLGALVLPAHFVVEKTSHYYSERKILSSSLVFVLLCFLGIFNWKAVYYDIVGSIEVSEMTNSSFVIADTKIGNERIGDMLTEKGEFPYEFGAGPYIYVSFLSAIFLGTIVMEGVDTSIMAKVTPAKLNRRFLNIGLLATLTGTLGRVFADVIITSSALLDQHIFVDFVTATFLPLMLLALMGLIAVHKLYDYLTGL